MCVCLVREGAGQLSGCLLSSMWKVHFGHEGSCDMLSQFL